MSLSKCPYPRPANASYLTVLTEAPLAPVRPLAPGFPYEEKEKGKLSESKYFFLCLRLSLAFLPNCLNASEYLQEVQRGQRDLEDPLHHGDQQDQKGRGYQQVRVHPKSESRRVGLSK